MHISVKLSTKLGFVVPNFRNERFGEDYPVKNELKVESKKLKVAILLTWNLKLFTYDRLQV